MHDPRLFLVSLFEAAIAAADPAVTLPGCLPGLPKGRTIVVGAGKAAASMARAVEASWRGDLTGLVVTRLGYAAPMRSIALIEAGHPVPDEASVAASRRIMDMVCGLSSDDLVLCLISGGGSALLALPIDGITLAEKQSVTIALLKSGATISEMNCVRRHLSGIKGGRLAAACYPAKVVTLLISDVPGDDPADIASGPTVPDPSSCADALSVLTRYQIAMPQSIRHILESGEGETIKLDDQRIAEPDIRMIATPQMALAAAARIASAAGVVSHILGDAIEGEARETGTVMAGIARQIAKYGQPFQPPCLLLSGGETTVNVRGNGCGGRNVEFLLSLAINLRGHPGIYALAGDTDGVDGQAEIAGAWISPDSIERAERRNISIRESLQANDGHGFFQALGDSVVTGPTLTNVNDFRAILITEEAAAFYRS